MSDMRFSKEQLDHVKGKMKELLKDGEVVELLSQKLADTILNSLSVEIGELKVKVNALEEENARLRESNEDMKKSLLSVDEKCDDYDQHSKRTCLRVFGLPETVGENTEDLVLKLCREDLKITIGPEDIDVSYRMGRKRQPVSDHAVTRSQNKPIYRPVLVKFVSYKIRKLVFDNKKLLKGSGFVIRKELTACRLKLYKSAVEKFTIKNVWTIDGKVYFKYNGVVRYTTRVSELADYVN